MKLRLSKNSFGIIQAIGCIPFVIIFYIIPPFLLHYLKIQWWMKIPFVAALGYGLSFFETRADLLVNKVYAPINKKLMRFVQIIVLPSPIYTEKRGVIICGIFAIWLTVIMLSIMLWSENNLVVLLTLISAPISSIVILNSIEKRWIAQDASDV